MKRAFFVAKQYSRIRLICVAGIYIDTKLCVNLCVQYYAV